ncbi:MAG: FAD-dependent oxidoreductase [Pseudomonadota bacterium]
MIGGGISGLGAAWSLAQRHDVSLFEAAPRLGGHSNTVEVHLDGEPVPVDTGFIVYNEPNYPNLTQLFAALDVETVASDMSFSVSMDRGAFEYFGSGPGLLIQPSNLLRPGYWRLMHEMLRFYRAAPNFAERYDLARMSLGQLLSETGHSDDFARRHLLPIAAAIWSSTMDDILAYPASSFVTFFRNHGLFNLGARPQWRSVLGGSRQYVNAISARLRDRVHTGRAIAALRRTPNGVILRDSGGQEQRYDQLVIASHADQALTMLGGGASETERQVLGAFRYRTNRAVLHRDRTLMPRRRRAWASWNYIAEGQTDDTRHVCVSYWMNRLQRLRTRQDIFTTLNPYREPAPHLIHGEYLYDHPQYDQAALQAQERIPEIQGLDRVWFCGSYCGYGFHEDGLQAGLAVAAALGAPAPWANRIKPMSPAWRTATPIASVMAAE